MSPKQGGIQSLITLALICGYVLLTALHDDGTPLLYALAGQGAAVGGTVLAQKTG